MMPMSIGLGDLFEKDVSTWKTSQRSPDLNSMKTVWCEMKNFIEHHYGHVEKSSYGRPIHWAQEAWDRITDEFLLSLLDTMSEDARILLMLMGKQRSGSCQGLE